MIVGGFPFKELASAMGTAGGLALGYIGLKGAWKKDAAVDKTAGIGQVLGGFGTLAENLRADYDRSRAEVGELRQEVQELREQIETSNSTLQAKIQEQDRYIQRLLKEAQTCREENERLQKRIDALEAAR